MNKRFETWYLEYAKEHPMPNLGSWKSVLQDAFSAGAAKSKKQKESHPVYSFCVELWLKEIHPNWNFNAGEGKALNEIIAQMEKYFNAGHERLPTTQEAFDFFKHFCLKLPNFYKNKNLKILNQNFDGIISEIKSGQKPSFNSKNSGQRFSEFAG